MRIARPTQVEMRHEQRPQPRRLVNVWVRAASGEERGEGRIVNISLSGALIESSAIRPRLEAPITLTIWTAHASAVGEIVGTVARHAIGGFAVHYAEATPLVHRLVEHGNVGL